MNIMLPIEITAGMFREGTNIPEVDSERGEILWTPSGTYSLNDLRVYAGGVYSCVREYTATGASPTPDKDPMTWLYKEPTNRMAPFDEYVHTAAKRKGEVRYVLSPGFFTGAALYGVDADDVEIVVTDTSTGSVLYSNSTEMWAQAYGEWEYLFGNLSRINKVTSPVFPFHLHSQIDVRVKRNDSDVEASLGFLGVGLWQTLFAPQTSVGGTQYGVETTPKSYSYFKRNEDGTYTRRKGRTAKLITASVLIDAVDGPRISALLEQILDTPVAVEASNLPKYGHVSTVGFVTGTVVNETWSTARVNIKVDGNV